MAHPLQRLESMMKTDNGSTRSVWMTTSEDLSPSPLTEDTEADVCVVGAGIAGLTTAYLLAKEGKSVIVLDDGPVGGGESSRTTAHFTTALDDRYMDLLDMHGEENTRRIAESHVSAIDRVERIVEEEKIDCGWSRLDGYLFLSPGEREELLTGELEAAHRAGLASVVKETHVPDLPFDTGACLRFPNQGQLHILQYLHGLVLAIEGLGGKIFTHTHVEDVKAGDESHVLTSDGKRVDSSFIVMATNTPVNDRVVMHTKQAAYRSYVSAFEIPKGSLPKILLWDTGAYSTEEGPVPYHYVRSEEQEDHDLLIVGGEDHKTGQADDMEKRQKNLEVWTRDRFPMAGAVRYHWSGQIMEPMDGIAFIGHNPMDAKNIFIATGDSGNGMTHGTIAGMLLTDLILGRENPWEKIYDPSRKPIRALKQFLSENLNVAKEYGDLLKSAGEAPTEMQKESGTVIQKGTKKIALYCDALGKQHAFSAICPHLGCVVGWNGYEKTWDCPCHGSRFAADGHVVNGPALGGLTPVKDPLQEPVRASKK